ncbi:MAG: Uma2 family endonuclease [Chloroflexaceae bacterium]
MAVEITRRRFTVDEYHQMAAAGILTEDDRVELIEGEIVEMSPIGSRHLSCVNRLNELFVELLQRRAHVSVQNPVRLTGYSEPEPELALLKRRTDYYADTVPAANSVLLIVEVADSSIARDRAHKIPQYARSGIPEAWLVNLEEDVIEVYRQPGVAGYTDKRLIERGGTLSPQLLPDITLLVEDVLGPAGV